MPSRSCRICLNVVSCPWPWFLVPMKTVALPLGANLISANSGAGPAARSIALTTARPRSAPRLRDASRREGKPATSARISARSMLFGKSPQSYVTPSAVIGESPDAQREEAPVGVERQLGLADVVARVLIGRDRLAPLALPLDGPPELARRPQHQLVLGVLPALGPEGAADVAHDDPDL